MTSGSHSASVLPRIDVGPLLGAPGDQEEAARAIDRACRELGFFRIVGHSVDPRLQHRMETLAHEFFALPDDRKRSIEMARAGAAWRGWFPLRGEVTSGVPDRKEGLYVGVEHAGDDPRVLAATPLHGANLFPDGRLGPVVRTWLAELTRVAAAVMRGVAIGLGLAPDWFERHLTADPTILFRIFHYPALSDNATAAEWGVGEHTDYGLLTVLAQDRTGGLEVRTPAGEWLPVPAEPGVLVCNIGDMLDRLTEGRYRSTPHRVRNTSGHDRLSFPFFYDPSWDAHVVPLPLDDSPPADDVERRWDGASVHAWSGTYGDYLTAKVAKVFPDLFDAIP